jgi:hypothetical protein
MLSLLFSIVLAVVVAVTLHGSTRRFVRTRLRYVDVAQRGLAPWVAGGGTVLVGSIVAALLPFVGLGTALTAGIAVGAGVAAAQRDIRQGVMPMRSGV